MSSTTAEKNNLQRQSVDELILLCDHLMSKTPITWFSYFRFTHERQLTLLSTSPEVDRYYFENEQYVTDFSNVAFNEITSGINYSKSINPSFAAAEIQMEYRKKFGLDNFLMVVEKSFDCCHIFMFASGIEQGHMINYYLNNISFLQHFITSNRDKIQSLVDKAELTPVSIELDKATSESSTSIFQEEGNLDGANLFLNERQEAMVGLAHSDFGCLTERELQCLKYIIRGLTSKEIANKLKISFRTVENYSARIKYKLGCRRKHDILRKYGAVL